MQYVNARLERIKNGFLIHFEHPPPEGWQPEGERPERIMGMTLHPEDTWYAADYEEATAILRKEYFEA